MAYQSQPFDQQYRTHDTFDAWGVQRLDRRPRRQPGLVGVAAPHRQRGPAAHLRDAPAQLGPRRARAASLVTSRGRRTEQHEPALVPLTRRRSTTRDRTAQKIKLAYDVTPTLHARATCSACGATTPTATRWLAAQRRRQPGLQRPRQHRRHRLHRLAGARRRRLLRHAREPAARDARAVPEEPHARRLGLGDRGQPVRLPARRQAPERRLQPAAGEYRGRRRRWRTAAAAGARWRCGGEDLAPFRAGRTSSTRATSRRTTSSATPPRPSPATGWPTAPALASDGGGGRTQLRGGVYVQDVAALAPDWKAVLGARDEHWSARDGLTARSRRCRRRIPRASAELVLAQGGPVVAGRAGHARQGLRRPRGAHAHGAGAVWRDVDDRLAVHQRPEPGAGEILDRRAHGGTRIRARDRAFDLFGEDTRDALYLGRTTFDPTANKNITRVQNIGRIATLGLEAAFDAEDWLADGLDLSRGADLGRLGDQGQRGLRLGARRHDRQAAAQHPRWR